MRFEFVVNILSTPENVWRCVTDPTVVQGCVAGLESLTEIVPNQAYQAVVGIPLGQKRLSCVADVVWLKRLAPYEADLAVRLALADQSSGAHAIAAQNHLTLSNGSPSTTQMQWQIDLEFQGAIAGMPPQLVLPLFQKQSKAFFTCLKAAIEAATSA